MNTINLKQIFRSFAKHKRFFAISIVGLSIAIATSSLLWMHIYYEKSYDQFQPETENLYRIHYKLSKDGTQITNSCRTHSALSWVLKDETELIAATSKAYYEECYMYTEKVKLSDQGVLWADSAFLNVFQVDMILGDLMSALMNKYTVAISEDVAYKYFGDENPIDKIIKLNEGLEFVVTGVFKSIPKNTHLHYDFVVSYNTLEDYGMKREGNWNGVWASTYIRKISSASEADIQNLLDKICNKYLAKKFENGEEVKYSIMPVSDIYLQSDLEREFIPMGNKTKVKLLSIIAIFIIVIAWVNNLNISTVLSVERAKESGIRKLNGASSWLLIRHYLAEAIVVNLVSFILSLLIIALAFPSFKTFVNNDIPVDVFLNGWILAMFGIYLFGGILFTGFLSAFIQASFKPIQVLNNKINEAFDFNTIRHGLTVFQFILAIILIGSTTLIFKQIDYLENSNLGMDASKVLVFKAPPTNNTSGERRYADFRAFRNDLLQSPHFVTITSTMNIPGQSSRFNVSNVKINGQVVKATFNRSIADENYFETYQVPLIAGRNFHSTIKTEEHSIIINEKAVRVLGLKSAELAIGAKVFFQKHEKEIVGVVQNFHHESLQKELEPYIYQFQHPVEFGYYPALVTTKNIDQLMTTAEQVWNKHYPESKCDFFFLDSYFNKQYLSYKQLGQLAGVSSILSIIIACMGLFALASYTVNKKIKEIGIRRVNGAKISEILIMLNKDFVKWVVIAFAIATPTTYYSMSKWLENFAYQTELSWWIFALAGVLVLAIAILTVSWQSWRAATQNPVEALRYE